ncbi:NADH:ubiquinone oxidoreductase, partial [Tulasnella sp. 417]
RDSVERSPPLAGSSSSARPPLLCTRSIIQSTRLVALHKKRRVSIYKTEALKVDTQNKQVTIAGLSDIKGNVNNMTIPYDMLVYAIGAETPTFGISSVKEHCCFEKELPDAANLRERVLDCIDSAARSQIKARRKPIA